MRSTLKILVIGCGIAAALAVPALACPYNTQASADKPQQTAQASASDTSKTQ